MLGGSLKSSEQRRTSGRIEGATAADLGEDHGLATGSGSDFQPGLLQQTGERLAAMLQLGAASSATRDTIIHDDPTRSLGVSEELDAPDAVVERMGDEIGGDVETGTSRLLDSCTALLASVTLSTSHGVLLGSEQPEPLPWL